MVEDRLLALVVPPDPAEVRTAREFVGTNLSGQVADDIVADLQLIVSELVTNAVEHATDRTIRIVLQCVDDEISITVVSVGSSPAVGAPTTWDLATVDEVTGRGLGIVRRLADRVEVEQTSERLSLTACRRTGGRRRRLPNDQPG